ncbi:MAG: hypothetical protein KME45_21815 [Stenomitos rutilans HA7619-LM2]|nr:hypothetical protein [Stenomitos rutilans HA7619-LM2]
MIPHQHSTRLHPSLERLSTDAIALVPQHRSKTAEELKSVLTDPNG